MKCLGRCYLGTMINHCGRRATARRTAPLPVYPAADIKKHSIEQSVYSWLLQIGMLEHQVHYQAIPNR